MSFPLDLTITGKPTPRTTERVNSARRPLSANRSRSTQSNIFGNSEKPAKQSQAKAKQEQKASSASKVQTKKSSFDDGIIVSRAQLEAARAIANDDDDNVNVKDKKHVPDGIPKLQFGSLIEKDDKLIRPMKDYQPAIDTPNSATSISWGTPIVGNRPPSGKKIKGGGWQVNQTKIRTPPASAKSRKHDDVPSLDLCLSKSNEGLKELAKVARQVHEDIKIEYIGIAAQNFQKDKNEKAAKKEDNDMKLESELSKQIGDEGHPESFNGKAIASFQLNKLGDSKKKHFVDEMVVVDQLSRTAISEQVGPVEETPTQYDPKQRRHHDLFSSTRSPITGSSSETALSKRLRFGARIITRNGHDAHREINGFFFPSDGTITMYEFRQFGTRSSALPFIQRNSYCHVRGFKKGNPFTLLDIAVGNDLHFPTADQVSLPESLKVKPTISFKITEVDTEAKEKLIYDGCRNPKERAERIAWIDNYESAEEKQQKEILTALRGSLQAKMKKRAVKSLMNLRKHFRKIDKSGDGFLDKSEFKEALREFRLDISEESFDYVWQIIDDNQDGKLDYDEFVRGLLGEMNEFRKNLVRKAFTRLDTLKSGVSRQDDLKKFFSAKRHPKVLSGESKEKDMVEEFVSAFNNSEKKGEVSYAEFQDYYEGLSIQTDSDNEFAALMRSGWGV